MKRTGGCACGAIRFEVTEAIIGIGSCHCTDCQKASGGGANYVALTPRNALNILAGEVKLYERKGGSGETVFRAFCGDCGTPLWSVPAREPFYPIKVGAFDDSTDLVPQMQVYVGSALPWHHVDAGLPAFEKMPPQG